MFVVSGDILSGVVKKGMTMKIRTNSGLAVALPIESVEFVKKVDGSEVGLMTICRDAEELEFLRRLEISDEDIEITETKSSDKNG